MIPEGPILISGVSRIEIKFPRPSPRKLFLWEMPNTPVSLLSAEGKTSSEVEDSESVDLLPMALGSVIPNLIGALQVATTLGVGHYVW